MNPEIWGPPTWLFLHSVSINYPNRPSYEEKKIHFEFFKNLQHLLPCDTCRYHYAQYFNNNSITPYLENKESLIKWVINLHNSVNTRNKKKQFTFQEVSTLYNKIYGLTKNGYFDYFCKDLRKGSTSKKITLNTTLACIIVLLIISMILYFNSLRT